MLNGIYIILLTVHSVCCECMCSVELNKEYLLSFNGYFNVTVAVYCTMQNV